MFTSAAAEAYEKYADQVVRFASAVAGPTEAEDVAATVMARVLTRPDWESLSNLRAYLFRSVVNETRSVRRSTWRRWRREVGSMASRDESAGVVRAEVLDAVGRLSPRQRALVYLVYWLDCEVADAAAEMDVSTRTAERELASARQRLEVLLR